jgi:MoaA/NifB/PqqE/SkfB family radical SAM enzyme
MDCPYVPEIEADEFWGPIRTRAYQERIPLKGTLELTYRCNLRCAHCYLTQADTIGEIIRKNRELSTEEIRTIIDQIVEEGCLFLLLTGGEPLLRSDFAEIYRYAKQKGLLVVLFTNGTLLTPELADLLADWVPRCVEITLYGYTQGTYERVTGIPGSYERCRQGIELLLERAVPLRLKTMVLTLNRHELEAMESFAESLGLDFRFDAGVHACIDGSRAPLSLRLSADEAVELEMRSPEFVREWRELYERLPANAHDGSLLYPCAAGRTLFSIDPYGGLSPCLSVRQCAVDLRAQPFNAGWWGSIQESIFQEAPSDHRCSGCGIQLLCNNCPGLAFLDSGAQTKPSEYLCQVAHLRARHLGLPYGTCQGVDSG